MFSVWVRGAQVGPEVAHASTARKAALRLATELSEPVEVCTLGSQYRKVRTIIHPDGRAAAPPKAETPAREACVRHTGRACYCTPCRLDRQAGRG